jgi:hypothetical protein
MSRARAASYIVDEYYDPDLVEAQRVGGMEELQRALDALCECSHPRSEHIAATGALGSFGGTACESCWTCPTFRPVREIR